VKGFVAMNRRHFFTSAAILLAGVLSACASGGGPGQDLAQQFLTERNGGTPVAIGVGGPNAPILGIIESVDGTRLTVKPQIEAGTSIIQLVDGAKIHKNVDLKIDEITVGASVTAFGTSQGDTFQAELLRIGGAVSADSGPMILTSSNAVAGAPPAGGEDQVIVGELNGVQPRPISGIVESISGRGVVLKDQNGASTTVTLADNGKIQKSAEVALAELAVGTFIMAGGVRNGAVFQATQVQILPALQ
jgi:hypothetical protein